MNLGNLNVHFSIPVLHKAGRGGTPFIYDLSYDSSVWTPVTANGTTQWTPLGSWGWTADTAALTGYVTASYSEGSEEGPSGCEIDMQSWNHYIYHDPLGRAHPFPGYTYRMIGPGCLHPPTITSAPLTNVVAADGSG